MRLDKTTNTFLILLVLAIFGWVMNYVAFVFIRNENIEISDHSNVAQIARGRIADLFGRGENDVKSQIGELDSKLLSEDGAVIFLETIEQYAKDRGVNFEIKSVTIDAPADSNTPTLTETLRINFEAEGSWQKINNLIFYLEHVPHRIALESVALSKLSPSGQTEGAGSASVAATSTKKVAASNWRLRGELSALKAISKNHEN